MRPFDEVGRFYGRGEQRRCDACFQYKNAHGEDRSEEIILASVARKESGKENLAGEGCINPAFLKPYGEGKFHRNGQDRRCLACYKWIKNHDGEERPREQVLAGLAWVGVRKENDEQKSC